MTIHKVNDLFLKEDLDDINSSIESYMQKENNIKLDSILGRILFFQFKVSENIENKITKFCSDLLGVELKCAHAVYTEYNNLYGKPNLPPHFDGDTNILVVDYQLKSNTSWDLGIDEQSYPLQDNSALIFNANEHVHWRPHKTFQNGEYIKMLFFRFYNPKVESNYSHLILSQDHEFFKKAIDFRNSLS